MVIKRENFFSPLEWQTRYFHFLGDNCPLGHLVARVAQKSASSSVDYFLSKDRRGDSNVSEEELRKLDPF